MTFLPIVDRELRVAARRRSTYWSRAIVAVLVIGIGLWLYLVERRAPPAQLSVNLFVALTIVVGLFALFSGVQATADCLAEEKRDGTLGLLFLTDLRGYDVVAGKLVAGSLNVFYGLLASLPMLAIPLLMGGVTVAEFWRMALVLVNTMFFSLAAGMFASAFTKSARHAASLCLGLIVGIAGLLPLTGVLIASVYRFNGSEDILPFLVPSPGYAFTMAYEQSFRGQETSFWISVILVHVMSWFFLACACLVLPRSWQDRAASVTRLRWRDHWMRWSLGDTTERARFRARLLDVNAYFWLAARSRVKPGMVWAVFGVLAAGWVWGWFKFPRDWIDPGVFVFTGLLMNTILKCWFASEASAQLAEDRRIGALELLLSTPLDVREILHGQFLALSRQFLLPVLFAIGVELLFMISAITGNDIRGGEDGWVLLWIAALIMLVADLAALFYVGQWQALTARNSNRANTAALARILALPWVLFGIFFMITVTSGGGTLAAGFIVMWLFTGLVVDAFFGVRAKLMLEERFREVATARYNKPESVWKRWFGPGASQGTPPP